MYNDRINRKSNMSSIVELFILFLLLLAVIVVITLACMTAREQSLQAGSLTDAVICAENTAEVTKGAKDAAEAAQRLEKMQGVTDVQRDGSTVTVWKDGFQMEIVVQPQKSGAGGGTYVDEQITVSAVGGEKVYELQTGNYIR